MESCTAEPEGGAPGPSLDWRLLPILPDYMSPDTWLVCFQASSTMARWVLQHATHTHLTLHLGSGPAAGGTISTGSGGNSSRDGGGFSINSTSSNSSNSNQANIELAQQLAAQATDVALTLHGSLLTPDECLRGSITSMSLQHVQLPAADVVSSTLQLHTLPRLHTLSLLSCRVEPGSSPAGGSFQPAPSFIHTLQCTHANSLLRPRPPDINCLHLALSLVDPAQLQTVISDEVTVLDHMHHMTALQELKLHNDWWGFDRVRQAVQQEGLLIHPGLKRLSLGWLRLNQDFSEQPCTLDSLQLLQGASTMLLSRLPLTSLKSLTVQREFDVSPDVPALSQALDSLQKCAHLAFVPSTTVPGLPRTRRARWQPTQPMFELSLVNVFLGSEPHAPEYAQLVSLCMQHMVGEGAFVLSTALLTPAVRASLAALPPTITTMCFDQCEAPPAGAGAVGVIASLPAHINHVVLSTPQHGIAAAYHRLGLAADWSRCTLPLYVRGVDRPLRVTLLSVCGGWQEEDKGEVRRWLAEHASSQLHVDFQNAVYK